MYRQARTLVRQAVGPLVEEPVPAALRQAIEARIAAAAAQSRPAGNVVEFPARGRLRLSVRPWAIPLAASLALLIAGSAGYLAGRGGNATRDVAQIVIGGRLEAAVGTVLDTARSGTETTIEGGRMRLIASLRASDGTLCREFEIDGRAGGTVIGLACRDNGNWLPRVAVAASQTDQGYAPASSMPAIDAYLDAIGAGGHLSPEDEQAALAAAR
jgi:hypothetical protein